MGEIVDISQEIAEGILRGINIIQNFSKIDDNIEIQLNGLSLQTYNGDIESWLFGIIETLFVYGIKCISHIGVDDPGEVLSVVSKYDPGILDGLLEYVLDSYECNSEDYESNLESYDIHMQECIQDLCVERIEFIVPLLDKVEDIDKIIDYIPCLVENFFSIYGYTLLSIYEDYCCKLNKKTIVMYISYDRASSFLDDIYIEELVFVFEQLLKRINSK